VLGISDLDAHARHTKAALKAVPFSPTGQSQVEKKLRAVSAVKPSPVSSQSQNGENGAFCDHAPPMTHGINL
jgi:hypothetical protein